MGAEEQPPDRSELPQVSVVVPCFNEERWIGCVLNALEEQSYRRDRYDLIVVDNNSTDGTRERVKRSSARLLVEPQRSSYRARNLGVRMAHGEYIAFLDGDCIPHRDWLASLVSASLASGSKYVAGRIRYSVVRDNLANRLLALRRDEAAEKKEIESSATVPAGNIMIHRSVFDRLGLFKTIVSGGDIEYSRRASAQGESIVFVKEAVVHHQCDLTNIEYVRRTFRIRYGQEVSGVYESGIARLLNLAVRVPWRPGVGAAAKAARDLDIDGHVGFVKVWLFLWLQRVAGYAGGVAGSLMAAFSRARWSC